MADMAALGSSAISISIGLYNFSQISQLRKDMDDILNAPELPSTLLKTPVTIASVAVEPLVVSPIVQSSSSEIASIQSQIDSIVAFSNANGIRAEESASRVTIAQDDVDRLELHVTTELVDARTSISQNNTGITANADSISINIASISSIDDDIVNIQTENAETAGVIESINSSLDTDSLRLDSLESNQAGISSELTGAVLDISNLTDDLEIAESEILTNSSNHETLVSSWNDFKSVAYVADNKLNVSVFEAGRARFALQANRGDLYAIHYNKLDGQSWTTYLANTEGLAPDGGVPKAHGNVTGYALRHRLDSTSENGLIIEHGDGTPVYSRMEQTNWIMLFMLPPPPPR